MSFAKALLERCESGRIGLTANELTGETRSEGSNPSLSASRPSVGCPWQEFCPDQVRALVVGERENCERATVLAGDAGLPEEPG